MRNSKNWFIGILAGAGAVCASGASGAATLDDIVTRLESLQRDNQAIRRDNEAMRKEISALRQQTRPQSTEPRGARAAAPEGRAADPQAGRSAMATAGLSPGVSPARLLAYVGPYDWSGFYVGAHVGYGSGSADWNSTQITSGGFPPGVSDQLSTDPKGLLGGIQAGFNQQFGRAVFGIEASLSAAGLNNSGSGQFTYFGVPIILGTDPIVSFGRTEVNWLSTVTGRAGYAFDNILLYAKAGVAAGSFDHHYFAQEGAIVAPASRVSDTRFGWTAGGGVEVGFGPRWSVKAEYNYIDFGDSETMFNLSALTPLVAIHNINTELHTVSLGVNYRFGGY